MLYQKLTAAAWPGHATPSYVRSNVLSPELVSMYMNQSPPCAELGPVPLLGVVMPARHSAPELLTPVLQPGGTTPRGPSDSKPNVSAGTVGDVLGDAVGDALGDALGDTLGEEDGEALGVVLGDDDGLVDGLTDGLALGLLLGEDDGLVGDEVGLALGLALGAIVLSQHASYRPLPAFGQHVPVVRPAATQRS